MKTLIPLPAEMKEHSGTFSFTDKTTILYDEKLKGVKPFVNEFLKGDYAESENGMVKFIYDSTKGDEDYSLDVSTGGITIEAATKNGAFYAVQTVRQLGAFDLGKSDVPCVQITDYPRFKWRGVSLDESRHFFGKDEVKRYLDMMAMVKVNVLHWHLSDDSGWRIEIKKYPLLTELGSKRTGTQSKGWGSAFVDDIPIEGFYTQEDIKEIVAYAMERGIMVVPEIDMPAHFAAALTAYNWLGCRDIPWEVPDYYGGLVPKKRGIKDWNRISCAGKETTYQFVYDIIDEVAQLFPSKYFHIGGDECPKDEWKKCPACQAKMKENNLANEEELQAYFNNKIQKYCAGKGIRLIGWNEILAGSNLDKSIIVQYWTPARDKKAEAFVNNGGEIIMSKHQAFYFDMTFAQNPLKTTYNFKMNLGSIKEESVDRIIGIEGEVWTEFIANREKLDMYVHPRMEALSEVAWSPESKRSWTSFVARLKKYYPTYEALGINYAEMEIAQQKFWQKPKHLKLFSMGDPSSEVWWNRQLRTKKGKKTLYK